MPSLPIPMITAIVLAFLLVRMWVQHRRWSPLFALLGLCAAQAVIISFAQHYQIWPMRLLQPITATLIPPVAWVAHQTTAVRQLRWLDVLHVIGPVLAISYLLAAPIMLDLLIPVLFLGYGFAILIQLRRGSDALPHLSLAAGILPVRIWQVIALCLIGSAFSDVVIVAANALGAGYLKPWIISLYSSLSLLAIGGFALSGALQPGDPAPQTEQVAEASEDDHAIMTRLANLMEGQKPYLDPDLTLTQLARKLTLPVKTLSAAINRATGENVSRYINAARIAAAEALLRKGVPVTQVIYQVGFNTKSNFNREFLRVHGQSPSEWIATQGQT